VSARPAGSPGGVGAYIDQVVRLEQFRAAHPRVEISTHPDGPPQYYWHGQVPGCEPLTASDLERLLDTLDNQVAARDAHARWPNWTFTRALGQWQAKETAGRELLTGRTLEEVEVRVAQVERINRLNG
jgi:hypothetical protein